MLLFRDKRNLSNEISKMSNSIAMASNQEDLQLLVKISNRIILIENAKKVSTTVRDFQGAFRKTSTRIYAKAF